MTETRRRQPPAVLCFASVQATLLAALSILVASTRDPVDAGWYIVAIAAASIAVTVAYHALGILRPPPPPEPQGDWMVGWDPAGDGCLLVVERDPLGYLVLKRDPTMRDPNRRTPR